MFFLNIFLMGKNCIENIYLIFLYFNLGKICFISYSKFIGVFLYINLKNYMVIKNKNIKF